MNSVYFPLPDCHKLRDKIIKKFISFRLKSMSQYNCTKAVNKEYLHASKSIAMHLTIN